MSEKEIRLMYQTTMCDLLNECKFHNFEITDDQLKKAASKRVLETLNQKGYFNV